MTIYAAYLPPENGKGNFVDSFQLVSDAKSPFALLFPPIWLAWHKLWLPLLVYGVIAIAILLLAAWSPSAPIGWLAMLPGLFLMIEGNELLRRKLERNGWQFAGVIEAGTREDAEVRFITENTDVFQSEAVGLAPAPATNMATHAPKPAGLFPE